MKRSADGDTVRTPVQQPCPGMSALRADGLRCHPQRSLWHLTDEDFSSKATSHFTQHSVLSHHIFMIHIWLGLVVFIHVSTCCAGGRTLAAADTSGGQPSCGDENVDHFSIFSNVALWKWAGKDTEAFRSSIDTQAVGGGSATGGNGHCSDFICRRSSQQRGGKGRMQGAAVSWLMACTMQED